MSAGNPYIEFDGSSIEFQAIAAATDSLALSRLPALREDFATRQYKAGKSFGERVSPNFGEGNTILGGDQ